MVKELLFIAVMVVVLSTLTVADPGTDSSSVPTHQKQIVNKDGGLVELITRVFEIARYAIDSSPLPSCNEALSKYLRRHDGPSLRQLDQNVLKASAALTEWQSALDHPRSLEYTNLTATQFEALVKNKTQDAQEKVYKAQARVAKFKNETFHSISKNLYSLCYSEARLTASLAAQYETRWNEKKINEETAKKKIAEDAKMNKKTLADTDDDIITDEDSLDDSLKTSSSQQKTGITQTKTARLLTHPAHHDAFTLSAEVSWFERAYIYLQIHIRVLLATGNALLKEFLDHELLPTWKLVSGFWETNYKRYTDWWAQGDKRIKVAKRLFAGKTTRPLASSDENENNAPPLAVLGEDLHLGLLPEQQRPPMDERLGKVFYEGKKEEDERRERRKNLGLKDPWTWLELTQSVRVTPENATFTAWLLSAEAVMCYVVAFGMVAAGFLVLTAIVLLLQVCSPFIVAYHIVYRWLFRIYVREFFWNHFVMASPSAAAAATVSAAEGIVNVTDVMASSLTLKSFISNLHRVPSVVFDSVSEDYGASAISIVVIFLLLGTALALVGLPLLMLAMEIIGKSSAPRTALALQAQRAREMLAARERAAASTTQQGKGTAHHGHSHAHGQSCGHSH